MKQGKKEISGNIQGAPAKSSSLASANQTAWSCPRSFLNASAGAEMTVTRLTSVAAQNQTNCLSLCKQEQDVMGFVQPLTDTCTFHSSYSLSLTSSAWFVSNRNIVPCHVRALPCKYWQLFAAAGIFLIKVFRYFWPAHACCSPLNLSCSTFLTFSGISLQIQAWSAFLLTCASWNLDFQPFNIQCGTKTTLM